MIKCYKHEILVNESYVAGEVQAESGDNDAVDSSTVR